jgi:hypothetical protein
MSRFWAGLAGLAAVLALASAAQAAGPAVTFAPPTFVSKTLAGGEPLVMTDPRTGTLVYTSHEGTTHLYGPGFFSPVGVPDFIANYRNQVNIWTSSDSGATWKIDDLAGAGFNTDPSKSQGFSDPDLTMDESGRIYDTGIDLANDAVFSSQDGGRSWDKGTVQCHDGDRPWLAGGKPNQMFMATDTEEGSLSGSGHTIFRSTDGGNTCDPTGTEDFGPYSDGGSYTGFGKLYYDHQNGKLVEPALFDSDNDGNFDNGVGVSVGTYGGKFTPTKASTDKVFGHWPAIAIDPSGTIYLVWDTAPTTGGASDACGNPPPAPNAIKLAVSHDFGKTYSTPTTIAAPQNARAFWPWVVAGDPGKLSIVWYQTNQLVDVDCQKSDVFVYDAQVFGADTAQPQITVTKAMDRPVSANSVCQGGTTCVAESFDPNGSKDRRLGDFFTNAVDQRGCVMIATGDATQTDPVTGAPLPVSVPLFIRQDSGEPLVGSTPCKPLPQTGAAHCADNSPPVTSYRRGKAVFARGRQFALGGKARDRGCGGHVQRVQVALAKRTVGARASHRATKSCRFVKANGKLTKPRSCSRRVWLRPRGTSAWKLVIHRRLPAGFYKVWARSVDRAFNRERISRRNTRTFRIRTT